MNNYNINDNDFKNSEIYLNYLKDNPSTGFLRIRAYTANEAMPIKNLKVIVSKEIDNYKIIFFEGDTDESGLIENISLPAPKLISNNLEAPPKATYDIEAIYNNLSKIYKANIYENIHVVQNINIVPNTNMEEY